MPEMLGAITADENVDIVVQAADFTAGPTGRRSRAATAVDTSLALTKERPELFVVLDGVGGAIEGHEVESLLGEGVLALSGFQTGLRALGHLVRFARPQPPPAVATPHLAAHASEMLRSSRSVQLAFDLVRLAGIETPAAAVVASEEEALAAAARIGYPLAAKMAGVAHKSDRGGVLLGIDSDEALRAAVGRLRALGSAPVLLQEQVTGGVEVILGLQSEPELGTFVLVGLGGIFTELSTTYRIRPVGLRQGEAEDMIRQPRGFRLLEGRPRLEAVDLGLLVGCLQALDALGSAAGHLLSSLDVNPLIIASETGGRRGRPRAGRHAARRRPRRGCEATRR